MLNSLGRSIAFGLKIAAMTFCLSHRVEAIKPKPNADIFHPQVVQADVTEKFTDVSELSDIQSDEWNFKVVEYFIQRYKIDTGYSLDFFQRQSIIKRQEFAFIVNKIIQYFDRLQSNQQASFATEEELKALRRLQSEFASELDIVKNKIAGLEKNSFPAFSTTTRLEVESIFALTTVNQGNKIDDDEIIDNNLTFSYRITLE